MKTIHRLKQYIEQKGISYNAFDTSIGAANGYIGKTIKSEGSIGSDMLEKIFSTYSDIDPCWLLTGNSSGKHIAPITSIENELAIIAHILDNSSLAIDADASLPNRSKKRKSAEPDTTTLQQENQRNALIVAHLQRIKQLLKD